MALQGLEIKLRIQLQFQIGNVTLDSVIVTDTLKDRQEIHLPLLIPTFLSATKGSDSNSLKIAEAATYKATYTIDQSALDNGGLSNSAIAAGSIFQRQFQTRLTTGTIQMVTLQMTQQ